MQEISERVAQTTLRGISTARNCVGVVLWASFRLAQRTIRRTSPLTLNRYGLAVDRREVAAFERNLASCASTALEPLMCAASSASSGAAASVGSTGVHEVRRVDHQRDVRRVLRLHVRGLLVRGPRASSRSGVAGQLRAWPCVLRAKPWSRIGHRTSYKKSVRLNRGVGRFVGLSLSAIQKHH